MLRCRNATQTSVVLEWDQINLATADVISLSLYRNGQKAGSIPRPTTNQCTKISGLAVDTEYTFHLVLRTTAGTYSSEKVSVKTHKMTDLSGITVTAGILPAQLKESLARAVERIGAKMADSVRIDTTHFVTTEGRGIAWEKAVEMNIPVVRPEWVEGCERGGRIVGVRQYYLDADPRQRTVPTQSAPLPAGGREPPTPRASRAEAPLPAAPAEEEERPANGHKEEAPSEAESAPEKESENKGEEAGDATGGEQPDEQKVRTEDLDRQKVRMPKEHLESEPEKEETTSEDADEPEPERAKTPGASSFQDIAL